MPFMNLPISSNCFTSRFTSSTEVPLPRAMRLRRLPFSSDSSPRSAGVIDEMIASTRASWRGEGFVTPLTRKLLRDLVHLRGQMAAIILVVTSGVSALVTMRGMMDTLAASQASYYETYRFADVFVRLIRAPDALAARIAAIPGVQAVEPRVVTEVVLDVPGLGEPATGRLVSVRDRPAGFHGNKAHPRGALII